MLARQLSGMSGRSRSQRDDFEFSSQPRNVRPRQSNRPSEYRHFEGATKTMRDASIRSLAEQVVQNLDNNGGRLRKGFLKDLLASAGPSLDVLQITRDSVNNEVRKIKAARKKAAEQAAAQVSATESSSPSDSSVSAHRPSSVRPPSSDNVSALTEEQANGESENSNADATSSNPPEPVPVATAPAAPALPNRCSYPDCGAPLGWVPQRCCNTDCNGTLHLVCRRFATIPNPREGKDECYECATREEAIRASSPCAWPNCQRSTLSTDPCSSCGAPVHRLCQAESEIRNEWSAEVEAKLLCPTCHPDSSPPGVARAAADSSYAAEARPAAASALAGVESSVVAAASADVRKRNKGGRPKGSTKANQLAEKRNRKKAVNWVVKTYLKIQSAAEKKKTMLDTT